MDCRAAQAQLSLLIDGDLDEGGAVEVREHLIECPACAQAERELRCIADAAGDLPPLEPPPDLWARINARLDEEGGATQRPDRSVWWTWRWAVAGGLGLAAATGAAVAVFLLRPAPAQLPVPAPPAGAVVLWGTPDDDLPRGGDRRLPDHVLLEDARREFQAAERHYLKATRHLADLVTRERRTAPFSPALAAAYDRNLVAIDAAIARCRELAKGAPDDPWAQEVLFAAYQRKIRFLEDILRSRMQEETL